MAQQVNMSMQYQAWLDIIDRVEQVTSKLDDGIDVTDASTKAELESIKQQLNGTLAVQDAGLLAELEAVKGKLEAIETRMDGTFDTQLMGSYVDLQTGSQSIPNAGQRTFSFSGEEIEGLKEIKVFLSISVNSDTTIDMQVDCRGGDSASSVKTEKVGFTREELDDYAVEYIRFGDAGDSVTHHFLPVLIVDLPATSEIRVTIAQPTGTSFISSRYSILGVR